MTNTVADCWIDWDEAVTVTVNSRQKLLKPGVSLGDLFPGDPDVSAMLRDAGFRLVREQRVGGGHVTAFSRSVTLSAVMMSWPATSNMASRRSSWTNLT